VREVRSSGSAYLGDHGGQGEAGRVDERSTLTLRPSTVVTIAFRSHWGPRYRPRHDVLTAEKAIESLILGLLRRRGGRRQSAAALAYDAHDGAGLSGSTQWHNAVRARFYMKSAKPDGGEQPDNDLREIVFKKNQYGPKEETIALRYRDGMFLPVPGVGSLDRAARAQKMDDLFLMLLDRSMGQGRNVSEKKNANTYAPARFAEEPEAKTAHATKKELTDAMERLFRADKIHVASYGYASRGWTRIERK
jgi:hypothetical protein